VTTRTTAAVLDGPTPMSAATRRMVERELLGHQLRQRVVIAEANALIDEGAGHLGRWVRDIERAQARLTH
jgi:hypothetical protein